MRTSSDVVNTAGELTDGFSYDLQVWVKAGVIQRCGHVAVMESCNACLYAGRKLTEVKTEVR